MSELVKSSGAMALATLISRILGMVREIVYARFMGDGWVAGAFQLAFLVPNLFRRLLGEGALTAAFIPIFKEKEKIAGESEMWRAANAVVSGLVLASVVVVLTVVVGITIFLASGVSVPRETLLMLRLLRIMFPYMIFVCLAAVFMGMLNARGYFFVPAMGATVLNVVMIASVLLVAPLMGATLEEQIFALAIGVLVAGIGQAIFQLPALYREGYRPRWVTPVGNEVVIRTVQQMIPGMLGVAAFQINVLITQSMAFGVDASIVASYNYAVRLMEFPQGVFGVSIATYLLPTLAGLVAEKKYLEYKQLLREGVAHLIFVNLFASAMLVVLAEPTVRLLFERGRFGPDSTLRVAFALQCLAPGLVAFSAVNIFARAFYALSDTSTPMKIGVCSLGLNLVLTYLWLSLFPMGYKQGAMGLANTMTSVANATILVFALTKKVGGLDFKATFRDIKISILGTIVASILAATTWCGLKRTIGYETFVSRVMCVALPGGLAMVVYFWIGIKFRCNPAIQVARTIISRLPFKK